jgi:hypothetical protein
MDNPEAASQPFCSGAGTTFKMQTFLPKKAIPLSNK